jgi:ABC-type polysaccharide/polyol phosphate transport system ATPase subunit
MALISFDNVTISYPVYNSRGLSLRNHLVRLSTGGIIERETKKTQTITALHDVSFKINHGDSVGLIGHNGAGKSTLLRAIAGIYTPTKGQIIREGRVSTMLELCSGMDMELSGYENIIRICLLMGENRADIPEHIKDIQQLTQLGDFLQMPVRTYSAGMQARLVFAIATCSRPDILLVDEIFGMGDIEFQTQAQKRMEALVESVGILVFASHSSETLKKYCNRFFRLEHGQLSECTQDDF